ncbi:MAG: hypothetical protein HOP19_21005, partial [Acidobacteria bacterium]|nr:hypothetical protein [Acidobacteriota bacterium]
ELVQHLKKHLKAEGSIGKIGTDALRFEMQLNELKLRGADNIHCLLVSGDNPALADDLKKFWRTVNAPERLVMVWALSETSLALAQQAIGHTRSLRFSSAQLAELLESPAPEKLFSLLLRNQLGRMSVQPFNILLPASNNMFFGRERELSRLFNEDTASFAIAGPSRLGKTSLVKQHEFRIRQKLDPRNACRYYFDFRDCTNKTPDGIAQFIALRIDNSSRSASLKFAELSHFLKVQRTVAERPLELILDEVDEVCQTEPFQELAIAAHQGLCRLILCGREVLLKTMLYGNSPLKYRLELLRLKPLDATSARKLVLTPLKDIGFKVEHEEKLVELLFELTGRMPHLLQFHAKRLAELADEEEADSISPLHIETLKADDLTANFCTAPIIELKNPRARLVALALLKGRIRRIEFGLVQGLARQHGINLSFEQAHEICNDLIINNILIWDDGYRIANDAITFYAHEMGFIDSALEETIAQCR